MSTPTSFISDSRIVHMECWTPILNGNSCDNADGPENLAMLVHVVAEPLHQDVKVLEPTVYSLPTGSCL